MLWRFTILDRNNVATVVDEPTGWDANTSEIKRDLDWHGVVFTNQGETFQFDGKALQLLKDEYEQYGIEGEMALIMEEDCGNGFEEFCRGKFMFKNYDFVCGDECYVKIPVETTKETKDLRNRLNQKVNLETTKAFDETTVLPAYSKLPFDMEMPSKGIILRDASIKKETTVETLANQLEIHPNSSFGASYGTIELALDDASGEIGIYGFSPSTTITTNIEYYNPNGSVNTDMLLLPDAPFTQLTQQLWNGASYNQYTPTINNYGKFCNPNFLSPIINFQEGTNNYGIDLGIGQLQYLIEGEIEALNTTYLTAINLYLLKKDKDGNYVFISIQRIIDNLAGLQDGLATTNWDFSKVKFSLPYNNAALLLNKGDELFLFISTYFNSPDTAILNGTNTFKITINNTSFFKYETLSHTPATISKVYAVNEVISRIAESITNNNLKAYSEYIGRTDSQPYSHNIDGCGSLEVLTDGLRIRRQENKIAGKPSLFSLSLQDVFEGLNPIHNIGMGLETDPNRIGYNRLRVEPWQYFYNNNVALSCTNVGKIERKCFEKEIYSTFQFGYAKWEAEEYTGLDEFLTKRTYRTTLNQVKNDLVKLSKFVASGYALEITRRKGDDNSKDWRYDKDTFIVCCKRQSYNCTTYFQENFYLVDDVIQIVGDLILLNTIVNGIIANSNQITISGTVNNNGNFTVGTYYFTINNHLIIEITNHTMVNENTTANVFSGIIFPTTLFVVEKGNITNPQHIVDPATVYNYRISPIRNAMRWMNKVLGSYRNFNASSKIIFTDGDANYYAEGEMTDTNCRLENAVIVENQTIDLTIYANSNNAKPLLTPERVVFDYPMSSKDYKTLETNPYSLIYFSNECEEGFGWIDTIHYKPEQGIATFNLIPKAI